MQAPKSHQTRSSSWRMIRLIASANPLNPSRFQNFRIPKSLKLRGDLPTTKRHGEVRRGTGKCIELTYGDQAQKSHQTRSSSWRMIRLIASANPLNPFKIPKFADSKIRIENVLDWKRGGNGTESFYTLSRASNISYKPKTTVRAKTFPFPVRISSLTYIDF